MYVIFYKDDENKKTSRENPLGYSDELDAVYTVTGLYKFPYDEYYRCVKLFFD